MLELAGACAAVAAACAWLGSLRRGRLLPSWAARRPALRAVCVLVSAMFLLLSWSSFRVGRLAAEATLLVATAFPLAAGLFVLGLGAAPRVSRWTAATTVVAAVTIGATAALGAWHDR